MTNSWKGRYLGALFILYSLAGLLAYAPSLNAPKFNFDDDLVVFANPMIQKCDPESILALFVYPTESRKLDEYFPFRDLTYAIDFCLHGSDAPNFRLTNLALHVLTTLLLTILLSSLGASRSLSSILGLIFLLHPVNIESVAWIASRKEILYSLCNVLVISFFWKFLSTSGSRWSHYMLALLAFLLALLSKISSISVIGILPVLVTMSYEKWRWKKGFILCLPFICVGISYGFLYFHFRMGQAVHQSLETYGFGFHLPTLLKVFSYSLAISILPIRQSTYIYLSPGFADSWWQLMGYTALFVGYLSVLVVSLLRRSLVGIGLTLFLLGLCPYLNIFPNQFLLAERYLYFPLMGLVIAIGLAINLRENRSARTIVFGFLILTAIFYGFHSYWRNTLWNSHVAYWSDVSQNFPRSRVAWLKLGSSFVAEKDWKNACVAFRKAEVLPSINPWITANTYQNMGLCAYHEADQTKAMLYFNKCLETNVCSEDGRLQARELDRIMAKEASQRR